MKSTSLKLVTVPAVMPIPSHSQSLTIVKILSTLTRMLPPGVKKNFADAYPLTEDL